MVTVHAAAFRPDVKCCSYLPHLPNFAVGGVLADASPEAARGRATIEQRIDSKIGVTPLGLDSTAPYKLLYANSKAEAFGLSRALRCPHYIDESGGLCGIWRHRNSVCSTYYCKFVRGAVGRDFWSRLHQLLETVEHGLERWCVASLDLGSDALSHLFKAEFGAKPEGSRLTAAALDGVADPALQRQIWGKHWSGREREFYIAAADLVRDLSWADVSTICGVQLQLYARLTGEAYHRLMAADIYEYLQPGEFSIRIVHSGFVVLRSYSASDQLIAPKAIVDIIPLFDGRSRTNDVLDVAKKRGVSLSHWYVQRLVDFAILRPLATSEVSTV
jgi:hypothetical protein